MPVDLFPVTNTHAAYLVRWGANKDGWQKLVARADEMEMVNRPAATRGNGYADTFEGDWLRGQGELLRMYPAESKLVPFYADVTKAVPEAKIRQVGPGDTSPLRDPELNRREQIKVSEITEGNLREVAARIAETRPGSNDGDTERLELADLDQARAFMTGEELAVVESIKGRYFWWAVESQAVATSEVAAYDGGANGVAVTLERTKTNTPSSKWVANGAVVSVTKRIENGSLVIQAPAGSRVLLSGTVQSPDYAPTTLVYDVDSTGRLSVPLSSLRLVKSTYRTTSYLPAERVGILVVKPNEDVGLPIVVDKVALNLPGPQVETVQVTAPTA